MIRTPQQYIESLNDGRVLYYKGQRVSDVTQHSLIRQHIILSATDWALSRHPLYEKLLTLEENGEKNWFLYKQPATAADLVRRREIYITCHRIGVGLGSTVHGPGVDALASIRITAGKIDKALGTKYTEAVENYRKYVKQTDPAIVAAVTDVKGDRSLHPSRQMQHKDFFVRVVDRQKDGIIVRGAKMHISQAPSSNEILVLPSRAHGEEDKDYAVVFATPTNAKGVKLVTSPFKTSTIGDEVRWDWPVSGRHGGGTAECMVVFDEVFVPWNRVFMCGEWQFSRSMAWTFATFHRLFSASHITAHLEIKVGAAALIAEYNGLAKYPHIQDKLSWLAMYAESCNALSLAACEHPTVDGDTGIPIPNLVFTNLCKYKFANDAAECSKNLADICGGIVATVPSYNDWMNPEERPLIEKYLAGKDGIPTEHRLKIIRLIKDLTSNSYDQEVIHGDGSLAAQRMAVFAGTDWEKYKAAARRATAISEAEQHPLFKDLPKFPPTWEELTAEIK